MQRVTVSPLGCFLKQFEANALKPVLAERGYTLLADGVLSEVHGSNACTIKHLAAAQAQHKPRPNPSASTANP